MYVAERFWSTKYGIRNKKSGKAITIDGAFSQAYGDYGFTSALEPRCTFIATHHEFESVQAAIEQGADIVRGKALFDAIEREVYRLEMARELQSALLPQHFPAKDSLMLPLVISTVELWR